MIFLPQNLIFLIPISPMSYFKVKVWNTKGVQRCCKDIGINQLKFIVKSQFLCSYINTLILIGFQWYSLMIYKKAFFLQVFLEEEIILHLKTYEDTTFNHHVFFWYFWSFFSLFWLTESNWVKGRIFDRTVWGKTKNISEKGSGFRFGNIDKINLNSSAKPLYCLLYIVYYIYLIGKCWIINPVNI